MADPKIDPKDAEIAALKAQLAARPAALDLTGLADAFAEALRKSQQPQHVKALRRNYDGPNGTHLVAPEHRGTHTYIVGPSGHMRKNRRYVAGDRITVTNERPAKDWKLADGEDAPKKPAAPAKPAAPTGRSSDQNVG